MKTIAFFNNKGGVGKTTLVYHLAWMYAELGCSVVAADLDPQAKLSAVFLDEERLERLWPDGTHHDSILGAVSPILRGLGDIRAPHVEQIADNLGLVVGSGVPKVDRLRLAGRGEKIHEMVCRCGGRVPIREVCRARSTTATIRTDLGVSGTLGTCGASNASNETRRS